jgi:hypothetical protein
MENKKEYAGEPITFIKKCDYDELVSDLKFYKQQHKILNSTINKLDQMR